MSNDERAQIRAEAVRERIGMTEAEQERARVVAPWRGWVAPFLISGSWHSFVWWISGPLAAFLVDISILAALLFCAHEIGSKASGDHLKGAE